MDLGPGRPVDLVAGQQPAPEALERVGRASGQEWTSLPFLTSNSSTLSPVATSRPLATPSRWASWPLGDRRRSSRPAGRSRRRRRRSAVGVVGRDDHQAIVRRSPGSGRGRAAPLHVRPVGGRWRPSGSPPSRRRARRPRRGSSGNRPSARRARAGCGRSRSTPRSSSIPSPSEHVVAVRRGSAEVAHPARLCRSRRRARRRKSPFARAGRSSPRRRFGRRPRGFPRTRVAARVVAGLADRDLGRGFFQSFFPSVPRSTAVRGNSWPRPCRSGHRTGHQLVSPIRA